MKVQTFITGPFGVNTYVIIENNECIIIDPAYHCSDTINFIEQNDYTVKSIMITHGHIDHFAGLPEIIKPFGNIKSFISKTDLELVENSSVQARMFGHPDVGKPDITDFFNESIPFSSGPFEFKLLQVPGHSQGSVCFYTQNVLFSGDTLFRQSIGRSDLFGGNHNLLVNSIKSELLSLPDDTIVYPGHGPSTTIDSEKKQNPFF